MAGLVQEVVEDALQGRTQWNQTALWPNCEADQFRQCSLSRIKRDKLLGAEDEGGSHVDDVKRAAPQG